jgi:hypothetical protein
MVNTSIQSSTSFVGGSSRAQNVPEYSRTPKNIPKHDPAIADIGFSD